MPMEMAFIWSSIHPAHRDGCCERSSRVADATLDLEAPASSRWPRRGKRRSATGNVLVKAAIRLPRSSGWRPKRQSFSEAARRFFDEHLPSWKNSKHVSQWMNTLQQY
jgi:hypothetical protein